MNYIKYAISKYMYWFGIFQTILLILSTILDNDFKFISIIFFVLSFIIPLLEAFFKSNFKLKTVGKCDINFKFGNLLEEECFVITTNRYFDIKPTGEYISENSLLGEFVKKYFPTDNDLLTLEHLINTEIAKLQGEKPFDYGTFIKILYNGKIIYFLVFTDRCPSEQPNDFYINTLKNFFEKIKDENNGKTISIPLLGDNNNLSNSGFNSTEMSLECLITMINYFEIQNQNSELKLKIMALPEKRNELIKLINFYSSKF